MVIFINGSINSGKSTISKILANKIHNTVLLEIDDLQKLIYWMPLEKSIPINLKNACALIKNFVDNKLNVIIPYPLSEKNYFFIKKSLKNLKTKIYFFTLDPTLEVAIKNRGRRLDKWEINRIKYHYKIGINKPNFGEIINNSNESPVETARKILMKIDLS